MNTARAVALVALCVLTGRAHGTDTSVPFIHADQVHTQGITGFGATVAVIDDGVHYGEPGLLFDIAPGGVSIVNRIISYDGGYDPTGQGHGTLVSLIITDPSGVAPDARILPIRVVGPTGGSDPRDVLLAIRYLIERRKADPTIRVINYSRGSDDHEPCGCLGLANFLYGMAIGTALNNGIVTFASTGNEANCAGINSPACVADAVKVAAEFDDDYGMLFFPECDNPAALPHVILCESNVVENCEFLLAAPGYDIWVEAVYCGWGASFATAHCSGVAALMFSKNPCGLSASQARQIIENTAFPYWHAYNFCQVEPLPRAVNALAAVNAVPAGTWAALGDFDCDGSVSGYDYPYFERCMTGPADGYPHTSCARGDFPSSPPDGDVDLRDLRLFQLGFEEVGSGACCHADRAGSSNAIRVKAGVYLTLAGL